VRRLRETISVSAMVMTVGLLVGGTVVAPDGTEPHGHDAATATIAAAAPTSSSTDVTSTTVHGHAEEHAATTTVEIEVPHEDDGHAHAADEVAAPAAAEPAAASEPEAHADGHGHDHDTGEVAVASPSAPAVTTPPAVHGDDHHDHATPATTVAGQPTTSTTVDPGPIVSIEDPRLTDQQRGAAQVLLDRTLNALVTFPDEQSLVDAGYVSIGDGRTGFEHYVMVEYLDDEYELDADHIESVVLKVEGGAKTVASAMYILSTGKTMADVPDIAGSLTTWHDHQNLCWDGIRVVGVLGPDGRCTRGEHRATAPMIHVWKEPQPCGPFSGIEGTHGASCADHSSH
jgi:hypothetical protein